jgi:transcriptional regulator with XRE-family HTH domain
VSALDPLCRAFGAAVSARRHNLGWSQEDLAHRAGLHRNYVGGVERGERNLGLINAGAFAQALGVPLSALIADAEERMKASESLGPSQ